MKTKLLFILSVIIPCILDASQVTFEVYCSNSLHETNISITKFDSQNKQYDVWEMFSFKKVEPKGVLPPSQYEDSPKNQQSAKDFFSLMDANGLGSHEDKVQKFVNRELSIVRPGFDFNMELKRCFFLNGYKLTAYYLEESDSFPYRRQHYYFFSK